MNIDLKQISCREDVLLSLIFYSSGIYLFYFGKCCCRIPIVSLFWFLFIHLGFVNGYKHHGNLIMLLKRVENFLLLHGGLYCITQIYNCICPCVVLSGQLVCTSWMVQVWLPIQGNSALALGEATRVAGDGSCSPSGDYSCLEASLFP